MVKGHRSIYTKVSHPRQVRFWRGNVTKIELAPSPPLPSPPLHGNRSTFRHFRRFLVSRRINASENRGSAPEKTGYPRVIFRATRLARPTLHLLSDIEAFSRNPSQTLFVGKFKDTFRELSEIKDGETVNICEVPIYRMQFLLRASRHVKFIVQIYF